MIVVLTLLVGILPVNTWAVDHVHDETCGYSEPSDCTHAHDDSCGYVAAVEGASCGHSHDAACGYSEGSAGTPCGHVHGDCGYAEASPCTFTPCDHSSCGYVAGSPCNGLEGCDHLETDNCGYVEGVECPNAGQTCDHSTCGYTGGSPCNHTEHIDCGYAAEVPGTACNHSHDDACGYVEAVSGNPCTHAHDDICGYSEGSACNYAVAPIDDTEHTCSYDNSYQSNGNGHWQVCISEGCGLSSSVAEHVNENNDNICDTCGYVLYTEGGTTYTVTYTDGVADAVIFADVTYTVAEGTVVPTYVPPDREGFIFDGWNPNYTATVTADTIFTAKWREHISDGYTVTYTDGVDSEEIFPDMVYEDLSSGDATPAFEGTPTREGFTFAGWNPEVAATVTGDATYTAQWTADEPDTPTTYTVTFYPNGGTGTMSPQTFTAGVEQSLTPNTYTREGYFFLRWNTAENGGGQGYSDGQSITVSENLTLYALWHQHTYGGYIYTDGTGHYKECSDSGCPDENKGRTATEPHNGNINSPMGCTDCHYSSIPLTVTINPTYLIGGGTISITTSKYADQVTAGSDSIEITTNDHISWTATIQNGQYAHSKFNATAGKESADSEWFDVAATFSLNPTIETLIGGGTVTLITSVPASSVTCNVSGINVQGSGDEWTATLPNSTATYTFTATLDNHTDTCTVSVVKSNTITFHGNSGSGSMEPIVIEEGGQVTLPACSFTAPDGFTFAYWSTKANGTGTQYKAGKILKPSADMTLYAIWKAAYVTDNSTNKTTTNTTYNPITIPVTGDDTVQVSVTVTEGTDSTTVRLQNLTTQQIASLDGGDQVRIDIPNTVADTPRVTVRIPSSVITQLSESTHADIQIVTRIAEVNIGSDALAENAGELVMEAQRTEDGISTKVTIGGVSVIDTGLQLPVGVDLPEDGKLVVGTLQPSADDLNFLLPPEMTEPPNVTQEVNVEAAYIQNHFASTFTGPGEVEYTHGELLLIDGKEYYLYPGSGSGKLQLLDKDGILYDFDGANPPESTGTKRADFPEKDEYISINGAVYQVLYSERDKVVLYMDGKIVGEYLNYGALFLYGDDYHPDKVNERQQLSGTVTTGETPIDGLESGKTYNVSVIGSNDISVPAYDEALLNSIKAETEEEKAAKEEVERLKADMEAKKAALDQLDGSDPKHMAAWAAWNEAEIAYKEALAELAALTNLQSATVTQKFQIPDELVGRTDVTFVAVHNTNPFDGPGSWSSLREDIADFIEEWHKQWEETYGSEIGTVEVSRDGHTLTATYTVNSFSPFTIYAFIEADEPEIKTLSSTIVDGSEDVTEPMVSSDPIPKEGGYSLLWIVVAILAAGAAVSIAVISKKKKK